MIDLHSHFLFTVDDGSRSRSETIAMLHQAEEAGFTDLVATPHVNEAVNNGYFEHISRIHDDVLNIIKEENLGLRIHLASEIMFDSKTIQCIKNPNLLIGKEQKYLLFELPMFFEFSKISQMIFDLAMKNIKPILAHPERIMKIFKFPENMIKWSDQGCLMQMNAGSIIGQFGKKIQKISRKYLESGIINLIASDAHEPKYRNYLVSNKAYELISSKFDLQYADILFKDNPNKILNGGKVKVFRVDKDRLQKKGISDLLAKLQIAN